jgi:hypothetical protein
VLQGRRGCHALLKEGHDGGGEVQRSRALSVQVKARHATAAPREAMEATALVAKSRVPSSEEVRALSPVFAAANPMPCVCVPGLGGHASRLWAGLMLAVDSRCWWELQRRGETELYRRTQLLCQVLGVICLTPLWPHRRQERAERSAHRE